MSYRVNPADFVEALYGEEDAEDAEQPASDSEEVFGLYDDEEDETDLHETTSPVYSSLKTCSARDRVQRDRSRSPVKVKHEFDPQNSSSPDIVIQTIDEVESSRLNVENAVHPTTIDPSTFWTPDAHALYVERIEGHEDNLASDSYEGVWTEGDRTSDRFDNKRSVRGRIRGGRRGCRNVRRGQGNGRGGRCVGSQYSRWEVGHPLEEIWVNDSDVPSELKNLAMDVVRKREIRAQQVRERKIRRQHERDAKSIWEDSEGEDEEEFQDATDERGLEGESLRFKWFSMDSFRGQEEVFTTERTGSIEMYSTPCDAFLSYWDDSIIQHIADETNRYASKVPSAAFQGEWYPTNSHEVLCLFAFWMMLGIIRMPTIASCFSTEPLLKTEIFRRIFTFNRYRHLTRVLSFVAADPATDPAASSDLLHCLRPIISHLNAKFKANYIPSKDICIDESLTLWKGSLNFKQCIWSQAARYGIKTFELCESATGYLWSFVVCTNKQNNITVVKKLVDPLLKKGHRLFMDNWCNSPLLARFLKRNGTDYVGTLRSGCDDVPVIINQAPLNQGQLIARHSGDVCVLSWQDQKRITMASTCHGSASAWATVPSKALSRPLPFKPQVVLDFNKWMGGVDLKDELLEPYLIERKRCNKWYMKLFKRLLNCSILNARILLQSSLKCPQDHLTFRLQIIDGILTNHLSFCPQPRRATSVSHRTQHPARILHHTHWPVRVEQTASDTMRNRQSRKLCTVCINAGRKSKRTPFKCEACDVPLCVENCFKIYHTA